MGIAKIVAENEGLKPPVITKQESKPKDEGKLPDRKAALSRKVIQKPHEKTEKQHILSELEDSEPSKLMKPIEISRARIVSPYEAESGQTSPDEGQEGEKTPAKADKVEVNVPEKFKGKSLDDVIKSYQELESLTSKTIAKNAEYAKKLAEGSQTKEVTKSETTQEAVSDKPFEIPKDLVDKLYDKPEEALKEITKIVSSNVKAELKQKEEAKSKEDREARIKQDVEDTKKWLVENEAEFLSDPAHQDLVDGLAFSSKKSTNLEAYQEAVARAKKILGHTVKATEERVKGERQEVDDMKDSASLPSGQQAPKSSGKKWKQSVIDNLITRDPATYMKYEAEITAAILEGRVIQDV